MGLVDQSLRPRPRIAAFAIQSVSAPWPPGAAAVDALVLSSCRFPIGEIAADDFRFCGRPRERGSYCTEHRHLAYAAVAS